MKRYLVAGVLALASATAGCGSTGPQGAPGETGETGPQGPGVDGGITPSVSGITPPNAFIARTSEVTISGYGTNWSSSTTVNFGQNVTVTKTTVASPTALVVDFQVDATAGLGVRDVTVNDGANTETYKGAFDLLAPITVTFEGNVGQGGNVLADVRVLDTSTPLDSTTDPSTGAYTNIALNLGTGITTSVQSVSDYAAQLELLIDVSAPTGTQTFDLISGPPGTAASDVEFPAPQALNVAAVTPTALTAGTSVNGNTAAPYDTSVYSFTPASASATILDFSISTTSQTATPSLFLLPSDGQWSDILAGGEAAQGTPGTFSYVSTQSTVFYGITWDNTGGTGAFTLGGIVSTAVGSSKAAATNDATAADAIVATSFPFVLTGGDLSDSNGSGDWVKVTMPSGKTSLRVQTSGDPETDAVVAVTTDGSTVAGTTLDDTETATVVDATFTGLTPGATYYVTFTQGELGAFYGAYGTDYTGIIRIP